MRRRTPHPAEGDTQKHTHIRKHRNWCTQSDTNTYIHTHTLTLVRTHTHTPVINRSDFMSHSNKCFGVLIIIYSLYLGRPLVSDRRKVVKGRG